MCRIKGRTVGKISFQVAYSNSDEITWRGKKEWQARSHFLEEFVVKDAKTA